MKTYFNKSWFTLIEFAVAMTLFFILSVVIYTPYNYYWNKIKLKQSVKTSTQLLYDSRNMAINWIIWLDKNLSIWLYFDTSNKNEIKLKSYPHDIEESNINLEWSDSNDFKTFKLQRNIQIDNISFIDTISSLKIDNEKFLFYFNAISWDVVYYYLDTFWNKQKFAWDKIDIDFSYKWSMSPNLNKTINYYTNTNIVDY